MSGKRSILIVDDDVGICQTLADILEAKGYQVATAINGFQAIEKAQEDAFDVALMDIKMPGMNGVETFRKMKKSELKTKVIMITAYAMEELIREAYLEGVVEVMHKPLEVDSLIKSIDDAIN